MDYKEDSTRGRALIKPRSYKGDALVQCWVDSRVVATLSNWLDNYGRVTRSLADVLKFTLEEVVQQLDDAGIIERVQTTDEARAILRAKYRASLNPGGRGKRNLLHNLHLDEMRSSVSRDDISKPIERADNDQKLREFSDRAAHAMRKRSAEKLSEWELEGVAREIKNEDDRIKHADMSAPIEDD